MKRSTIELYVGVFVIAGLICCGYLFIKLGDAEVFGSNTYSLYAKFQSVTGLKTGASVEIAGVRIGEVGEIRLEFESQTAMVRLDLDNKVELTDDTIASIKTSGLIGDRYVSLLTGGSDEILRSGDTIVDTESAVIIEDLISKYIFSNEK